MKLWCKKNIFDFLEGNSYNVDWIDDSDKTISVNDGKHYAIFQDRGFENTWKRSNSGEYVWNYFLTEEEFKNIKRTELIDKMLNESYM